MKKIILIVSIALILSACAGAGVRPASYQESLNLNCDPLPNNYQEMIKTHVNRTLIDPTSGIYEFSQPAKAKFNNACAWYLQVEVNAKNRFGGYVGRQLHQFVIYQRSVQEVNAFQSGMINGTRR